jgi:aspartate-semialdehyde dehydrogenase
MRQSRLKRSSLQPGRDENSRRLPAVPMVAIVGATGAVGAEMVTCLEQRYFPLTELRLLASARSAGKTVPFAGGEVAIDELNDNSFAGVDIALFAAGATVSKHFAPIAVREGAVVIDNSSAFRMDPEVPLVVPEVNLEAMGQHGGIIANPNCVVIIAAVALWPIHRKNRIRRLTITTYQAASGAGAAAMEELRESTRAHLDGRDYPRRVLPHDYAFNLFSHNTSIDKETGYNGEETKVLQETRKIFGDPDLRITATCVRVPVLRAHAMALNLECEKPIDPAEVRAMLDGAPGLRIVDDAENNRFPMPKDASGQDDVLVGRIRRDVSDPSGHSIAMFAAGDQLLKGAALNAVQIAERLLPRPAPRRAVGVPMVERMGVI